MRFPDWRGRGVLVTGASSGIGLALARRLAAQGARLVLVARREGELARIARELHDEHGAEVHARPCDLANVSAAFEAGCDAQRALAPGGVELLVNNAGVGGHRRVLDWPLEEIERMTALNYLASVALSKAVLPSMVERRRGAIVFIASVAGKVATPLEAPYAATKSAMISFGEALSLEVEEQGVHVLNVCPGMIDTPFFAPDELAAMPAVARRGIVGVDGLVDAILAALARGKREITHPRAIAAAYPVKAIAPAWFRRAVAFATRT